MQRIDGLADPVELTAEATGAVAAQLDPITLTTGSDRLPPHHCPWRRSGAGGGDRPGGGPATAR